MKFPVFVAGLAAVLVAASPASSAPPLLTGSFRTVISGKSSAQRHLGVENRPAGPVDDREERQGRRQGAVGAWSGHFQITDASGPAACKGVQASGAYTYTLNGNKLALKLTFDQCSGRKTILTAHPLTKISN